MELRNQNKGNFTTKDFFSDLIHVAYTQRASYVNCWPDSSALGSLLWLWKARLSVGYDDLIRIGAFGSHGNSLFGGPCVHTLCFPIKRTLVTPSESVLTFLRHYSGYDFLKPADVGKFGVRFTRTSSWESGRHAEAGDPASFCSGPDFGMHHRSNLKEMMSSAFKTVGHRRSLRDVTRRGSNEDDHTAKEGLRAHENDDNLIYLNDKERNADGGRSHLRQKPLVLPPIQTAAAKVAELRNAHITDDSSLPSSPSPSPFNGEHLSAVRESGWRAQDEETYPTLGEQNLRDGMKVNGWVNGTDFGSPSCGFLDRESTVFVPGRAVVEKERSTDEEDSVLSGASLISKV